MDGTSSGKEALRGLLLKACEVGLDHLVMLLAFERCRGYRLREALALRGVTGTEVLLEVPGDVLTSLARDVWGYWKCGGKHHWILRKPLKRREDGVLVVRVACYACKLEKIVSVEEAELGRSKETDRHSLLTFVTSVLEGDRGC